MKIPKELEKYISFYEADTGDLADENLDDFYNWVENYSNVVDLELKNEK
jgi:hypothetical protein